MATGKKLAGKWEVRKTGGTKRLARKNSWRDKGRRENFFLPLHTVQLVNFAIEILT